MDSVDKTNDADDVFPSIYRSIDNPTHWKRALACLCRELKAFGGMLCQCSKVADVDLTFTSAYSGLSEVYCCGLPEKDINKLLTNNNELLRELLRACLSDDFDRKATNGCSIFCLSLDRDSRALPIFSWAKTQHITDLVLLEVGGVHQELLYMAFFFDVFDRSTLKKISDFYPHIDKAWKLSKKITEQEQWCAYLYGFLELEPYPAMLVGAECNLIAANSLADTFVSKSKTISFDEGCGKKICVLQKNKYKEFCDGLLAVFEFKKTSVVEFSDFFLKISFVASVRGSNGACLVVVDESLQKSRINEQPIWQHETLTKRESQLVKILSDGGGVVDFIKKYDLAKSTGHLHWANAKRKLNVNNISEIYAAHQVYLAGR